MSTTAIYARINLDPVREAVQKVAAAIFAHGGIAPKANIVALGDKRAARKGYSTTGA